MRHQKILHTDQDEVRILIQKHNDLYEIQYMLDMHSNTIKPLFQHMFQELCKM